MMNESMVMNMDPSRVTAHSGIDSRKPVLFTASMIWSYIGELIFNMLVLVGTIKMSDRIVKEMMGL